MGATPLPSPMRWLSNVRLPEASPCRHRGQGPWGQGRWRIGLDGDDRVRQIERLPPGSAAAGDDWGGDWLSPMGVDLQINGGLGLAFPELTAADQPRLQQLLELLWRDGVEAICPTLVTCAVPPLREALETLRQARAAHQPGRCRLLGAHLEGPFLAPARRGAHPLAHLCPPSPAALQERIGGFWGPAAGPGGRGADTADIALVTLAPELEGAAAVIQALRDQGIVVSLGHSTANDTEAMAAYDAGVAMVTHAFNAMAGLGHRDPGPIAAAALRGDVALGLIADGVHVAPAMAVLLQRLAPTQVVLVSDALAPYGLAEGLHPWDERSLVVANGSCRLEDGTLAGVTLPLLEGVRRLAGWSSRPEWAIAAATVLPRHVLGDRRPVQELLVGRRLEDCLRWSPGGKGGEGLHWQFAA